MKCGALLVIAVCCGLLGIVSCAVCAQFFTEPATWLLLASLAPVAALATSSEGVACYCRFSSKNQDERTIADQQRRCRDRAARDGHQPDALLKFSDEAVSGAAPSRAGFDEMMEAARTGRIKVLYFVNLSRLARDCLLTLQTMRELVYLHKVRVVSIDEGIDTAQSESWELLAAILGIQHEQFLKKLAIDVFGGQEGVVLDHFCVGDYCFGYGSEPVPGTENRGKGRNKKCKTKYIIKWDEVEWVIKIFFWFTIDRRSLRWIARELNKAGAPKDHRSSTPHWHHIQVAGLLANRKYIGWWSWGKNKNIRHPITRKVRQEKRPESETEKWLRHFPELQVINDEVFATAQKRLADNAENHTNHRFKNGQLNGSSRASHDAHPRHLLSGLIECQCARKFSVGGAHGKYLFCRGYSMGTCTCQTTLNRALAEELILYEIGKRIASNPEWLELLCSSAQRSFEKLQRELPSERRRLEEVLADVEQRIRMLIANSEKQVIPELEERIAVLRDERLQLKSELKMLLAKGEQGQGPPKREWIVDRLGKLHEVLKSGGPAAAHALRALVGGKIVVTEVRRPGRKRHFLRGQLELHLCAIAEAAGVQVSTEFATEVSTVEKVVIDFRRPERREEIADEAKKLRDDGLLEMEIATQLGCGRALVPRALDLWYEKRGLIRPDGRTQKKRLKNRRKADQLQPRIMEFWHQDLSVTEIARRLDCGLEIVREAVANWHTERGMPIPDGRTRRREIRLKRRAAG
jgi:DNA invertase Pin-like site-specific DNA recombinase